MNKPLTIALIQRVNDARHAQGISQADLARALQVDKDALNRWLCGRSIPDSDNALKLAAWERAQPKPKKETT